MSCVRAVLAACGLIAASVFAPPAAAYYWPDTVDYRVVASGLDHPADIRNAGDDSDRLFIVEARGTVRILASGALLETPFLDLRGVVKLAGEAGMKAIAFDPHYATNRRFFVSYVRASDNALRVSSFVASATNRDLADPASELEVITVAHPWPSKNYGGDLQFGPDGMLFASTGDGGLDSWAAQDATSLLGKVLRLDVSSPGGYALPADNYYASVNDPIARREIAVRGLRDPRKFTFDPKTGDMYIADVGGEDFGAFQEIDALPANFWRLHDMNYGWPYFTGFDTCRLETGPCPDGMQRPLKWFTEGKITGGRIYHGNRSRMFSGRYFYGRAETVPLPLRISEHYHAFWSEWDIKPDTNSMRAIAGVTAIGEDEVGNLYFASSSDGTLYAIEGTGSPVVPQYASIFNRNAHFDFNGDGRADILWEKSTSWSLWLMDGATHVVAPYDVPQQWPMLWRDFDGDGKTDRLMSDLDGSYWLDLLDGGTVRSHTRLLKGGGSPWEVAGSADFNGDGKADLLWRNGVDTFGVWLMNGASTTYALLAPAAPSSGVGQLDPVVLGDFNGDGKADIAWHGNDGSTWISLMDGASMISTGRVVQKGSFWVPSAAADFNGDGKADLLWRWADGSYGIWLMEGATYSSFAAIRDGGSGWFVNFIRDIDGDGKADIVWMNALDSRTEVWLMEGLAPRAVVPLDFAPGWFVAACDDYNGDGKAELMLRLDWLHAAMVTSLFPPVLTPFDAPGEYWAPWDPM